MPKFTLKDMLIAFNKTPEDAYKFFKKLGIQPSGNWKETLKALEADAFAIAGIDNLGKILDAKDLIEKAIKDGTDLKKFKEEIQEALELRNWHADLVVTQNISNAYHSGTWTRQQSNEEYLPLVVFMLGGRAHHTEGCLYLANNKIAVRLNDPDIAKLYPARHFNCGTITATVDEEWCKENGYKIMKISDISSQYYNAPGFGFIPTLPVIERTDFDKYPDDMVKEFKKKVA